MNHTDLSSSQKLHPLLLLGWYGFLYIIYRNHHPRQNQKVLSIPSHCWHVLCARSAGTASRGWYTPAANPGRTAALGVEKDSVAQNSTDPPFGEKTHGAGHWGRMWSEVVSSENWGKKLSNDVSSCSLFPWPFCSILHVQTNPCPMKPTNRFHLSTNWAERTIPFLGYLGLTPCPKTNSRSLKGKVQK